MISVSEPLHVYVIQNINVLLLDELHMYDCVGFENCGHAERVQATG